MDDSSRRELLRNDSKKSSDSDAHSATSRGSITASAMTIQFGKKRKRDIMEMRKRNEILPEELELICYNAVKRVQKNS